MNEPYEILGAPAFLASPYPLPSTREVGILAAARRHWPLILGFMVAGTLSAYLLCRVLTPLYAANATVMINPREPKQTAVSIDPNSTLAPSEEAVRKNEIALVRSRQLAEAVVLDLGLEQDPEFNSALRPPSVVRNLLDSGKRLLSTFAEELGLIGKTDNKTGEAATEGALDRAVDLFLNRLGTTSTDASRVIEIRFSSEHPERASRVANAVVQQYMQQKVNQDFADAQFAISALQHEISALNIKIRDSERAIEKMRGYNGVLPTPDLKVIAEQLTELNKELITASGQRAAAEARLADLEAARLSNRLDSVASVLDSRLIQRLKEQAAQQAAKIAEMSTLYDKDHPKLVQARAQLKDVQSQIDSEIAKVAATYRSDFAVARAKETGLRKMIESAKAETAKANASEVDVRVFEREAEANRTLMGLLVARLNDTEAQLNRKGHEARLLARAIVPQSPSFPPKIPIVVVALLFSATCGTVLSLLLERRDQSIRSTAQLRHMTTARVLGAVPAVKRAWWQFHGSPTALLWAQPTSMFVENLRAIWFQIDHTMQAEAKTLVVTSAVSGEGKTSIVISLARLLALRGRRVVIIDADLRHPNVHRTLGLKQRPGLTDVLEGSMQIDGVLQKDEASGAFFVAAGAAACSPADYLESPKTLEILKDLSGAFDAVIIDTPPLLPVHDAGIMARHADITIMVVRWGATRAATFVTALQRLQNLDIPLRGVVLSMVDRKRYGQYGSPDSDVFARSLRKYYSISTER